jgi:hypothetical protein
MGQINFIRCLIGEKLSFGTQFGFNQKDWNFREQNLVFTKSID